MKDRRLLLLMMVFLGSTFSPSQAYDDPHPRLVVLTDISSLTAGVAEPDDGQSLIRLILYTNEFDIEGLIATSNLGHGQKTRPDLIRQVVDGYEKVRPNLLLHDPRYPPAEALRGCIKAGQQLASPNVLVEASVGQGKDTAASEWIVRVVDRPDPRPLWVVIWGGSADLAQALAQPPHVVGGTNEPIGSLHAAGEFLLAAEALVLLQPFVPPRSGLLTLRLRCLDRCLLGVPPDRPAQVVVAGREPQSLHHEGIDRGTAPTLTVSDHRFA